MQGTEPFLVICVAISVTTKIRGSAQPVGFCFVGCLLDELNRGADVRDVAACLIDKRLSCQEPNERLAGSGIQHNRDISLVAIFVPLSESVSLTEPQVVDAMVLDLQRSEELDWIDLTTDYGRWL